MKVGGVQKSLHNLLWELEGVCETTLLLFNATGAYMKDLPPWVSVQECKGMFRLLGMSQGECKGTEKFIRGALALISRWFGRTVAMKIVLKSQKMLPEKYDCAISFLQNGNINC